MVGLSGDGGERGSYGFGEEGVLDVGPCVVALESLHQDAVHLEPSEGGNMRGKGGEPMKKEAREERKGKARQG